jgi:GDP-4-dehydro-6-deoxy-D-mannose reductase
VSRDFLHVDDVVRAYELAAELARPGDAYNVCSGQPRTIRQALETLIDLAGVPVQIEVDSHRLRTVEIPKIAGSHEKLTRDTGWKPDIPFAQLLEDLLVYWKTIERSTA